MRPWARSTSIATSLRHSVLERRSRGKYHPYFPMKGAREVEVEIESAMRSLRLSLQCRMHFFSATVLYARLALPTNLAFTQWLSSLRHGLLDRLGPSSQAASTIDCAGLDPTVLRANGSMNDGGNIFGTYVAPTGQHRRSLL